MSRALHRSLSVAVLSVLAISSVAAAHDAYGTMVGVRGGSYRDTNRPFAGLELVSYVGNHFFFNPNGEYVFLDNGQKGTLNFDLHVDIPTSSAAYIWVGGGLGLLITDQPGPGGSNTSPRGNILAGVGVDSGRLIPYFQLKLIAGDQKEAVVALGLRF